MMDIFQTNCYILVANQKGIIFDPSTDNGHNVDRILKKCKGIDIEAIVLTHGHYDHISGAQLIAKELDIPIYIHPTEEVFLTNNNLNIASQINPSFHWTMPVKALNEGTMDIGSFKFEVVLTPGHTPGHVSLFYQDAIFSGDVLFRLSIGRTDLPGGSHQQMQKTLNYFNQLEEDYTIYCGHGDITQLSFEKKFNPYLTGRY